MAPTITVYKAYYDASSPNQQRWENGVIATGVTGGSEGWYYALYNLGTARNMPAGYTFTWRFYAWQSWKGLKIGEDSETMKFSNGTQFTARAFMTYDPNNNAQVYGWGDESWSWWFEIYNIRPIRYTLYFNSFGTTGGSTPAKIEVNYMSSITLPGNTFIKEGYNFRRWAIYVENRFVYFNAGETFTWGMAYDNTAYSDWNINTYVITFNNKGIGTGTSISKNHGDTFNVVDFPILKAIRFTFDGWSEIDGGNRVSYSSFTVNNKKDFYARWQENTVINFSELNRVYGARGSVTDKGANSISIGKFRAESGRAINESIRLNTDFRGKG